MVSFVKLNQKIWAEDDYSSSNNDALTGTIYSNDTLTTAKDLTGCTIKIRFTTSNNELVYDDDADVVTAASGTWRYKPGQYDVNFFGFYRIQIEITDSNGVTTAVGINGSSDLLIYRTS